MLSFPKALAGCGLLLGGAFILFFATLSIIDQFLLASLARKYGRPSSFKKVTFPHCSSHPSPQPTLSAAPAYHPTPPTSRPTPLPTV